LKSKTKLAEGSKIIYFDNAATTPLCDVAKEILMQDFANPSSPHALGLESERAVKIATKELAGLLSCQSDELIFTSGGTESNNLGILGAAYALKSARGRNRLMHILATDQAHPSVTEPLGYLASLPGYSVTYAAPSKWEAHICEDTALVCITQVSSETGDIFDVTAISQLVKKVCPKAIIFVDGAQGFCKLDNTQQINHLTGADIYAFSSHKIHGPMGVGGLMIRKKEGLRLVPMMYGGGQQNRIRPGTENVSGILAMAAAAINNQQKHHEVIKIKSILLSLADEIADTHVNHISDHVSPYILSMSFTGVRGETLTSLLSTHGICVSMGTACRTNKKESILESIGFSRQRAESAIRLSFSDMNTEEEAHRAKAIIKQCITTLRKIKPRL